MTQPTDITLAGAGYMLVPGSYRRTSDSLTEPISGTWLQRDFIGGQRRAIQLEQERGWDSEGVGPALFGQGVEPWPYGSSFADATITLPDTNQPVPAMLLGDAIYIGIGRYLYRSVALSAGSWGSFTQVADLGSGIVISSLAPYADKLAIACGATLDIQIYNPSGGTVTTLATGEKGDQIVGYSGQLIWSDATSSGIGRLRLSTGGGIDTRRLDSAIVQMALHGGRIVIATRSSLYQLGGHPDSVTGLWIGEPEPTFTQGVWTGPDDFRVLISFGGKLYAWLGNQLLEWNPPSGGSRQGWRSVGLEGREIHGATVSGQWLIVSIRAFDGSGQVWAFDGSGWWMIESGIVRLWPVSLAGAGSFDLLGFRDGSATYDLYRLVHRDTTSNAYRSAGAWRTSLLDLQQPDELKAWRSLQAFFATPQDRGNISSADYVTLEIRYSTDGGRTWTSHTTDSVGGTVSRVYDLGGPIAGTLPISRYLQVEIRWSSVTDWSPTLTAIAVGYDRLRRAQQRWQMAVRAQERQVLRDGSLQAVSAPAVIAALWSAWETGLPLSFRDVDYDTTLVEHQVRVLGISETGPEHTRTGTIDGSVLHLILAET